MPRWANIVKLYTQMAGDTPVAYQERHLHLADAQRLIAGEVDVPELAAIDASVTVLAGADYVETSGIDYSVYAVLDVFNVTEGIPMWPEPGGMTGRRMYLEQATAKPAVASLTHYQRDGTKLYVRGTAEGNTTIQVRVQRQMPDLVDADLLTGDPILPPQYDRALAHRAAGLYFLTHPRENRVTGTGEGGEGEGGFMQSREHEGAANRLVAGVKSPRVEEDRARGERFRLSRFRAAPRSRRGR